ncbi:nuclear transport factor 2 family protein [uncultured Agrococcus sp.]|uniref:nuclear transport factor 2 family protein n=1 Tax=uncultured Agrococcus sp. TaxID=382258 RepID=UPI0025D927FF|nr:nuclear transport factor 2 family protein [uncultured Agrococcus sp.]
MTDISIPQPIVSFIETVNRHDEEGFLNAFTPSGEVDDWGRVFLGRDAIKGWSDKEFIGAKGTMTPERVFEENGEVVVIADWRSNHANGLSRFAFRSEGDLLTKMTIREG